MLDLNVDRAEVTARSPVTIWGIGLCYEYDQTYRRISIIDGRRYRPILDAPIDTDEIIHLPDLIHIIEKITQIQALMLSNNATCDISEVMNNKRLKSYLEHVIELALATSYLNASNYQAFANTMCANFELQKIILASHTEDSFSRDFFKSHIKTKHGNEIICEGFSLSDCLSNLSRKVISDLLVMETSHNFQADAHLLLKLSSDLSMFALVLDKRFIPRRKIKPAHRRKQAKTA